MARVCKHRKGIWTVLTGQPKDRERRLIWDAFRIARHSIGWGDLAAWREGTTGALIGATEEERELFHYIFDTTLELGRKQ
jgi:hypothetical protein